MPENRDEVELTITDVFQEEEYDVSTSSAAEKSALVNDLRDRYIRQVMNRRDTALMQEMAKYMAVTWLPGRYRQQFPDIIDMRDPRMVTMDRYPEEAGRICINSALVVHRPVITTSSKVIYAGPNNVQLFKNFSVQPKYGASGIVLDARNTDVYKVGLLLDEALERAAKGETAVKDYFSPPGVLFGFPKYHQPILEMNNSMLWLLVQLVQPSARPLNYLLAPCNGRLTSITDTAEGFKVLTITTADMKPISIKIPSFARINVEIGAEVIEGIELASITFDNVRTIKELCAAVPRRALEWMGKKLLEEYTEVIQSEDFYFDRKDNKYKTKMNPWVCVPFQLVRSQMTQTKRIFLDFRLHLGRETILESGSVAPGAVLTDNSQCRIDVINFGGHRPMFNDACFVDQDGDDFIWAADLMMQPNGCTWADKCALRGRE